MSSLTPQEQKMLQQAETRARLEHKNKEAARIHLLAMQALLARKPILPEQAFK